MAEPAPPAFVLDASLLRQYYDSFDDLLDDIQTSLAQGFALHIRRSLRFVDGKYMRYDFACVCWGPSPALEKIYQQYLYANDFFTRKLPRSTMRRCILPTSFVCKWVFHAPMRS